MAVAATEIKAVRDLRASTLKDAESQLELLKLRATALSIGLA